MNLRYKLFSFFKLIIKDINAFSNRYNRMKWQLALSSQTIIKYICSFHPYLHTSTHATQILHSSIIIKIANLFGPLYATLCNDFKN